MRISPIKQNIQTFKQNWHVFAYDDEMSQKRREYIREHMGFDKTLEEDEIRNSGRLEEFELNQLIKSLILEPPILPDNNPEINKEKLYEAYLPNLESTYGYGSYKCALGGISKKQADIIKQAGISTIVFCTPYGSKDFDNIKTFYFPVQDYSFQNAIAYNEEGFIKSKMHYTQDIPYYSEQMRQEDIKYYKEQYQMQKREAIDALVKYIKIMQKENVLIGCEFGTHATDSALVLDFFFNPKADIMLAKRDYMFGLIMMSIYRNLTPEDKKAMGWDEEFDKNFPKRLEKYGFLVD